ncbi:MAG: GNAT family N-acetyltransferase [Woeseiaceae bacterium]|nr:GNAT family N-acetyltransferase [Woeseiaceae bacterium]
MSDGVLIERSESGSKGRYEARLGDRDGVGELTYSRLSETKIIADHTGVDESLRGMGVGKALVERLIADARKDGFTIVPLCPYVKAQYQRHPEWSDVIDT